MSTQHLTDEIIQEYLDGGVPHLEAAIRSHLQSCGRCRRRLAQYEQLYVALDEEVDFQLSENFAENLLSRIPEPSLDTRFGKWLTVFLWIFGLGLGIGTTIYYLGFEKILNGTMLLVNPFIAIYKLLLTAFQNFSAALNLNLFFVVSAGLVILIIFFIDRLFLRQWLFPKVTQ